MRGPLLDVVAVSYEARDETGNFLDSLVNIDVPYRLLIIDNASPDDGVRRSIIERLPARSDLCRSSAYVFNTENVGYARAVNQAMTLLPDPAPYAAILNADTEFLPRESMAQLLRYFQLHPRVGVLGPRTYNHRMKLTHAGIVNTEENPRNHHRGWMMRDHPKYRDIREANTVSGATYFVRRSAWDELTRCPAYQLAALSITGHEAQGAFLPTPHFFEETFCSYHARKHGWGVVYFGPVAMIHQWHRSSPIGSQPMNGAQEMFLLACKMCDIDTTGEQL